MKHFLLIVLLLSSVTSTSQSLRLAGEASRIHTAKPNTWVATTLAISNVSAKPVRVAVRRVASQIDQSQRASLCFADECAEDDQPMELTTLFPGESAEGMLLRFNTGYAERNSTIKYFIYNLDDPEDGIYHALTYRVFNDFPHGVLFSHGALKVGNAYPNPATDEATIDYSLVAFDGTAQVVVHNLLGNRVLQTNLEASKGSLKLPTDRLDNGLYFYSLYLNGEGVVTKKLVIRK